MRKFIRKFIGLSFAEKKLFLEAVLFLFTAKFLLLVFPFKSCIRFLSCSDCNSRKLDMDYLQSIKIAINRANRIGFWKNVCLVQSFAARWMLMRRKIYSQLSLGIAYDENKKIIAHAWICVDDYEIVSQGEKYIELIKF